MGSPCMEEFTFICVQMNEYEDGDLVRAGDIQDAFDRLSSRLIDSADMRSLSERLSGYARMLIRGVPYASIEEEMTRGLDLLGRGIGMLFSASSDTTDDSRDIVIPETGMSPEFTAEVKDYLAGGSARTEDRGTVPAEDGIPVNLGSRPMSSHVSPPPADRSVRTEESAEAWGLNREAFQIFLHDARERLVRAQDDILVLENDYTANKNLVHDVFRIFHTIKGEAGFFRLTLIGGLSHDLETLLDLLRGSDVPPDQNVIDSMFAVIDVLSEMLDRFGSGDSGPIEERDGIEKAEEVKNRIAACIEGRRPRIGRILVEEGKVKPEELESLVKLQAETSFTKKLGELAVESGKASRGEIEEYLTRQKDASQGKDGGKSEADRYINVKAGIINDLTDMIQELVIAENQLSVDGILTVRKITRKIQNIAMQLRTVKIKTVFVKLRRVIRDLSLKLHRPALLELVGEELEVDRNLVEALEEPLLHIVRNSMDHGIESPDERRSRGKPETGTIMIRAERKGNRLNLVIRDDGRGIDREKVLEKAVHTGIVAPDAASGLSAQKIYDLILLPGFSTAEKVSDVSGRGVGMDVVSQMVTASRGKLHIDSESGRFTEIILSFPLNTAIIDGMVVDIDGYRCVIPVNEVIECIELTDDIRFSVHGDAEVIDVRGEIIPVLTVRENFGGKTEEISGKRQIAVIVTNEESKYAIIADGVREKTEVGIKSLGRKFCNLRGISSATIFSGGRIGFILDTDELVHERDGVQRRVL